MKKIFTFLCLFIIANTGFAQQFHFGLKVSPGIYWITTDATGTESNGANMGFNYGAVAEFAFSDNYAFATGVDVSNKAGSFAVKIDKGLTYNADMNLQYLEIPLTIKMKTNEIGYFKYFGQFGLGLGFNLSGSYTADVFKSELGRDTSYSIPKTKFGSTSPSTSPVALDASLIRASLIIGAGLEYNLTGSTSILAGVSWDNGFLKILQDKKGPDMLLKGILLNVGILF